MVLSYLNKKKWHTGSFQNIERVWLAEQKANQQKKQAIENAKKLKEEIHEEELKKLQVEAGYIPKSYLDRMSWMYEWGTKVQQNQQSAEEHLLGKKVDEKSSNNPTSEHFTAKCQEEYCNSATEDFSKLHEDPLFAIRQEELRQKQEIMDNPIKMKNIYEEINKKNEKKKLKKLLKQQKKLEKKEFKKMMKKMSKKEKGYEKEAQKSTKTDEYEKYKRKLEKQLKKTEEKIHKKHDKSRSRSQHRSDKSKRHRKSSYSKKRTASRSLSSSSAKFHKSKYHASKHKHHSKRRKESSSSISNDSYKKDQFKPVSKTKQIYEQYLKDKFGNILVKDKNGQVKPDFGYYRKKFNTSQIQKQEMTRKDQKELLDQMKKDAEALEKEKRIMHTKDYQDDNLKQQNSSFITKMKNDLYDSSTHINSLSDRLQRNKNAFQRNITQKDDLFH